MQDDSINQLKAQRDHLTIWLQRNKDAQSIVPVVQKMIDDLNWQIDALSNRPEEAEDVYLEFRPETIARLTGVIPPMPAYDGDQATSFYAATTSGSATVFGFVSRVGDIATPGAQAYSSKYLRSFQELRSSQDRPAEARELLVKLNKPNLLDRFDRAVNTYSSLKAGVAKRTAAASEMRTLIDGLQGILFERATEHQGENMNWEIMSRKLAKGTPGEREEQELLRQKAVRGSIISRLSDVLKDHLAGSATNMDNIWSEVLDHIYVVLSLVKE